MWHYNFVMCFTVEYNKKIKSPPDVLVVFLTASFNLPDHSILSMGVIVIEKIYHHTNSPSLSTPYR